MSPGARPSALVVGAGIVGAACAEALAGEGFAVTVLDGRFPGAGATAAGMGHLVVMDDSAAQLALTSASCRAWRGLDLPADCEREECGTLWVAADAEELAHVESKAAVYRAHGLEAEVLDERALARAEPNLRPGLAGALRVPGDAVLYPPNAARALLASSQRMGAEVRQGLAAESVGPRWVASREGILNADLVLVAAGAESVRLLPELPIAPRKGHLVITDRYPGFVRHQLVELGYLKSAHTMTRESVAFNVQPRATGQLLIGSSRELVGWDAAVNRLLLGAMLARAAEYMPGLAGLSALRVWTGFRPATEDKLPLIGKWEDGLWVAAGHEGLGITTALATGRLVADLIAGRTPEVGPAPFCPRREMPAHG